MAMNTYYGSGRATCRECLKMIKKNEMQVNFSTYQHEQNFHLTCVLKKASKVKQKVI